MLGKVLGTYVKGEEKEREKEPGPQDEEASSWRAPWICQERQCPWHLEKRVRKHNKEKTTERKKNGTSALFNHSLNLNLSGVLARSTNQSANLSGGDTASTGGIKNLVDIIQVLLAGRFSSPPSSRSLKKQKKEDK